MACFTATLSLRSFTTKNQICYGAEELARYCRMQCSIWRGDMHFDNNFKYFVFGAVVGAIGMACMRSLKGALKFAVAVYRAGREALELTPPAPNAPPPEAQNERLMA
ncbi:hypothetical protein Y032_1194g3745 [Ancylostoma ceylanicum]|nr:hypothetical protein Y032_1194g3745 [Ancylostoma ceylanicum]